MQMLYLAAMFMAAIRCSCVVDASVYCPNAFYIFLLKIRSSCVFYYSTHCSQLTYCLVRLTYHDIGNNDLSEGNWTPLQTIKTKRTPFVVVKSTIR